MRLLNRCPERHLAVELAKSVRRFLLWLFVLLVVGGIVGVSAAVLNSTRGTSRDPLFPASASNLQTALTGVEAYYLGAHTLTGLATTGEKGVPPIQQTDTGLIFVIDSDSTGNNVISLYVATDGTYAVMAVFAPDECWGILYLTRQQTHPVVGLSAPGTYDLVKTNATSRTCNAGGITPDARWILGWPSP